MTKLFFASLFFFSLSAQAAEVAWDWPYEDSRVTHFEIRTVGGTDGPQTYSTDDVETRALTIGLTGGETLTAFACSETTCSPPSNELWIPNSVQNIRVTWGLQ